MWKFLHLSIKILIFDAYTILYIWRNFRHRPQFGQSSFITHGSFKCLPVHSSFHNHSLNPFSFDLITKNCRGVSHTPSMAGKWHVRGWKCVRHKRVKSSGSVIMSPVKWPNRCRGVSHTPFIAAKLHIRREWCVGRHYFVFANVRAYAIRPYTCSIDFWGWLGMGWFHFRPREGVCDTPLHLFVYCRG